MWFRNLHIYRLNNGFEHSPEALAELLESKRFSTVGRQDTETFGWISPLERSLEHLIHSANGCILLCMRREQKVIPASVVKETLEERVKLIEDNEGRKVFGKERTALKDDILSLLKPKALSKSSHIYGYIDTRRGYLLVNAGSNAIADTFIQLLIDSLGSLGAIKLICEENPSVIMNNWFSAKESKGLPDGWTLNGVYEFKDPKDERQAKFKDNELVFEESSSMIRDLLEDGYWLQKLGIHYKDQFSAIIQHDLQIKSIKYVDELLKENDDTDDMDRFARFDADFVLMSNVLADFIADLIQNFKINTDKE